MSYALVVQDLFPSIEEIVDMISTSLFEVSKEWRLVSDPEL